MSTKDPKLLHTGETMTVYLLSDADESPVGDMLAIVTKSGIKIGIFAKDDTIAILPENSKEKDAFAVRAFFRRSDGVLQEACRLSAPAAQAIGVTKLRVSETLEVKGF